MSEYKMDTLDYGGVRGYYVKGELTQEEFKEAWTAYHGEAPHVMILENLNVHWKRKVPDSSGEYGFYMHSAKPNSRGAFKITEVLPFELDLPKDYYSTIW